MNRLLYMTFLLFWAAGWTTAVFAREDAWRQLENKIRELEFRQDYTGAYRLSEQALSLIEDNIGTRTAAASGWYFRTGRFAYELGMYAKAADFFEEALAAAEAAGGEPSFDVGVLHHLFAEALDRTGREAEAAPHYREALALYHAAAPHPNLAPLLKNLCRNALEKKRFDEAAGYLDEALSLGDKESPEERMLLGELYERAGKREESARAYERALALLESRTDPESRVKAARIMTRLLEIIREQGDRERLSDTIDRMNRLFDPIEASGEEWAASCFRLAAANMEQGRPGDAQRFFLKAANAADPASPNGLRIAVRARFSLGMLLYDRGRMKEAGAHFREALSLLDNAPEEFRTLAAELNTLLGKIHYGRKDYAAAEPFFLKALEIEESLDPRRPLKIAVLCHHAGSMKLADGNLAFAREYFKEALERYREVFGENHAAIASIWNTLGVIHHNLGEPQKASEAFQACIEVCENLGDQPDLRLQALQALKRTSGKKNI
jgi:tetratricopeptide (TPR) repeat protein